MREQQHAFAQAVLDAARAVPAHIQGPQAQPAPRRFGVYRNNVVVSLVEAICQGFPALVPLVGEDFFRAVAREYVVAHPPSNPVMLFYGQGFPEFLERFEPTQGLTFLPHVARIDWAWRQAYHAADAPVVSAQDAALLSPEALQLSRFDLHPSVWVGQSPVAALDLWQVGRGLKPQDQVTATAQAYVVGRPALEVQVAEISGGMCQTLQALGNGETLGLSLERGLEAQPDFDVPALFQRLFSLGLVTAIHSPSSH